MSVRAILATASLGFALAACPAIGGEPYRPEVHFSPAAHWMNDPNGLIYYAGEYHLFFQYHPASTVWGPMHWGHAVSRDLFHWQELPVALEPDERGAIFSGSVVLDPANRSGLGTPGHPPLVALYTYHDQRAKDAGHTDFQSQGLAFSLDRGRHWTKYAANPVLPNPGLLDFRDPSVAWFAPTRRWIMTLAAGDHVSFYSSADLRHWTHESDFGAGIGAHGGVWECPNLFRIGVQGTPERRDVLLVSANAAGRGTGIQYFVGRFDGHRFQAEDLPNAPQPAADEAARWLDDGADAYAGVTWNGLPEADGRRILLGWMNNWDYALHVPTGTWRGVMTLPRELTLVRASDGLALRSRPVRELAHLHRQKVEWQHEPIRETLELDPGARLPGGALDVELELDNPAGTPLVLELHNRRGEHLRLSLDPAGGRWELDRSASGEVGFADAFPRLRSGSLHSKAQRLRLVIDTASVEIFLDEGATVLTDQVFPAEAYSAVTLRGTGGATLRHATFFALEGTRPHPASTDTQVPPR